MKHFRCRHQTLPIIINCYFFNKKCQKHLLYVWPKTSEHKSWNPEENIETFRLNFVFFTRLQFQTYLRLQREWFKGLAKSFPIALFDNLATVYWFRLRFLFLIDWSKRPLKEWGPFTSSATTYRDGKSKLKICQSSHFPHIYGLLHMIFKVFIIAAEY